MVVGGTTYTLYIGVLALVVNVLVAAAASAVLGTAQRRAVATA